MIIVSNKPGQLGNLLFIYTHFLAYGAETNTTVLNPAFYEYRSYFSKTTGFSLFNNKVGYSFCYLFARLLFKLKIKTKFINILTPAGEETVDLENASELKSTICFVQGWLLRSDRLVVKHSKNIRDFFLPAEVYNIQINNFFENNFPVGNKLIIGVHIRRGDYKNFEGGKYYYSIKDYIGIIKQMVVLFKDANLHFLICSNEKTDLSTLESKKIKIINAPGHELLDMYCMARCNYIIGPPSTYSMWASFYGNVPLYMIKDLTKEISIYNFEPLFNK